MIDAARWDVGAYAGVKRASAKVANYYFGVRVEEVGAGRGQYQSGAVTHCTLGVSAAYKFAEHYALLFGAQTTRLGGAAAASPIVETRNATIVYLGLAWRL